MGSYKSDKFKSYSMKRIITAFFISLLSHVVTPPYVDARDSIPVTDLSELVVRSERAWVSDGVFNFIPSKREKKLADSPESLIANMNIPILKVRDGRISTPTGEEVTIFINGEPADDISVSTFWPKNVRKVEFMENPSDPKFRGARNVLNFMVSDYTAGGVSRIRAVQRIPSSGNYTLSSKLTYRRMTYGALFRYLYVNDNTAEGEDKITYRDMFYDGTYYPELIRVAHEKESQKKHSFEAAVNATYRKGGFSTVHTISLSAVRRPEAGSESDNQWSHPIFSSSYSSYAHHARSMSPQVSGSYYIPLSGKVSLAAQWKYAFSRNRSFSMSRFGDMDGIETETQEKANSLKGSVNLTYAPTGKLTFLLISRPKIDWYHTSYPSNGNETVNLRKEEYPIHISGYWNPSPVLRLALHPGLYVSRFDNGGTIQHEIRPMLSAGCSWNPSRKLYVSAICTHLFISPSASRLNPALIQNSNLMWTMGNPELASEKEWRTDLSVSWLPVGWFTLSGRAAYSRTEDAPYEIYVPASPEMGGLVRTFGNTPPDDRFEGSLNMGVSLFGNRMQIDLSPQWNFLHARGDYAGNYLNLSFLGAVSYMLDNWRFSTSYTSPRTTVSTSAMGKSKDNDQWDIEVSYSFKDLLVTAGVENILHARHKSSIEFNSPNYSTSYNGSWRGRMAFVRLTYTLGYGKKTSRDFNIDSPANVDSSILEEKSRN